MGRIRLVAVLVISVVLFSSWVSNAQASKKPAGVARKEDVPFIKCQVCEKLAMQLHQQVLKKQAEISPQKISEYQIIEIAENACNLKKQEADWILKIDIVEQGDRLELVEQDSEGQCNSKCKTIERACQEVMGYSDTDIAEYIFKNQPQIDSLTNVLCKDLTKACSKKPPAVPKNRIPGEPFVPKSSKEAEMDRILKSMEGMPGAPNMKMYSRDDLMGMKNLGAEEADEDEDGDEANFPSNLGKVLRDKEVPKTDWKQTITKAVKDSREALKRHGQRISHRARRWWRAKRAAWFKKSSKASKQEL